MSMKKFLKIIGGKLNISKQCRELNVNLWSCPQFLFIILGFIIISSILVTNTVAQQYAEGEIVALIVLILTVFLFVVSYVIVGAFEKVVVARQMEAQRSKELLELKDQFVFIAAHELKTPATAIQKGLEKLESKNNAFFIQEKETADKIKENNNRLLSLVQDLLEVARLQGKTIHVVLGPVSIIKAYTEAAQSLEVKMKERNIKITTHFEDNIPTVHADERRLKEVFINFLSNAIKYSDKDNGQVDVKINQKEGRIVVSVSNNGPQISDEDQMHVFQKFWRSKTAQKSKVEGTGLGLFIVKQLVEMMEGKTWFTSQPDKTTFFVSLEKYSIDSK